PLRDPLSREVCHAVAAQPRRRTSNNCTKSVLVLRALRCSAVRSLVRERRCVYVLESLANPQRHYTGLTTDVAARLAWHNSGLSYHTAKFRPWRVLVSFEFAATTIAVRFERYLKSGSGRAFARRHFSAGTVAPV